MKCIDEMEDAEIKNKLESWKYRRKQAGAELGQAQPELGIRLNCDLFKPGKLIIGLELGLNTIPGSTHVA